MQYVSGFILSEEGFIQGHLGFEDGVVHEVGNGAMKSSLAEGIIVPTFVNAHTHIGDYIVPIDLSLPLEEVVAPPHGLKYRMLAKASPEALARGMKELAGFMSRRGVSSFIDFREGGIEGSVLLRSVKGGARPIIMGRPKDLSFDREEVDKLLEVADGVGVSGMAEWDYGTLYDLSSHVRSRERPFVIHGSERIREDIDKLLDLKPSFLVHMCQANDADLAACLEEKVPIVLCPRSNLFFGIETPLQRMIKSGVELALGTDNAMISMPDMLTEMEFAARLLREQGEKQLGCVLRMTTIGGRKILNERPLIGMKPGSPCDFTVIQSKTGDPMTDLLLRSAADDPLLVCMGRGLWRKGQ
jgi:cytosine/adenosine deaminase-related metal-dependent hydrolase